MKLDVILLAAGKGKRMKSSLPKVLHLIGGRPMLCHVIETIIKAFPFLNKNHLHLVVGNDAIKIQSACHSWPIHWVTQSIPQGTGDAVKCALPFCTMSDIILVLYGDVPLIRADTLKALADQAYAHQALALLTMKTDHPRGYGRIIRDQNHQICSIVEEKDASDEQKKIDEVYTGIMAAPREHLSNWIAQLKADNQQNEYYLTDVISIAQQSSIPLVSLHPQEKYEVMGVNTRWQQAEVERKFQTIQCQTLMNEGLQCADPTRIDIRGNLTIGNDVFIDTNCIFEGDVVLGNHVSIGSGCIINHSTIEDHTIIAPYSIVEKSHIAAHCHVGPFARLRKNTVLKKQVSIGNFVETKETCIDEKSKVNHLSYIGDSHIGKEVNIGAGTITCNYDGAKKHQTTIKDHAFIGSNTSLVAPLTLGKNVTTGAGSTITMDANDGELIVARNRQRHIKNWKRPTAKSANDKTKKMEHDET